MRTDKGIDVRTEKLADILVGYAVDVRQGDWVVIQTTIAGEPLAHACLRSAMRAGGHPSTILTSEGMQDTLLSEASDEQLSYVSPIDRLVAERADAVIRILAPEGTRPHGKIDPARVTLQRKATAGTGDILLERDMRGDIRRTVTQFPTEPAARGAGMSLPEYEDFVYRAAFLHTPDPIGAWRELSRRQQTLIDWLRDKRTVRLVGPGTDLTVSIAGRSWNNSDGHRNFPSGEVFTGPIEDATEGVIEFNYPAYFQGSEVHGVRLVFEGGKVVEARAREGEAFLHAMLNIDDGARRLGEVAFGTNDCIQTLTKNTLFDEKIGGTMHMALGRSYPETGGTNVSALHWDMVYDLRQGAEVTVDGQIFSRDGKILV